MLQRSKKSCRFRILIPGVKVQKCREPQTLQRGDTEMQKYDTTIPASLRNLHCSVLLERLILTNPNREVFLLSASNRKKHLAVVCSFMPLTLSTLCLTRGLFCTDLEPPEILAVAKRVLLRNAHAGGERVAAGS